MALTLAAATADVRQLLNEPTAVFWSDTEIQDWLNEGTRIVSSKTLLVEDTQNLTLVQDQLSYASGDHTWIGSCLELYAAIYDNGSNKYKGLQVMHPKQIGNLLTFTSGDPRYIALHNRKIYIWPLPSSTTDARTVSILYAKESDDYTEITDEFQHLPILWAQARAMEKDHKMQQAAAIKAQFYTEMQFERADKEMRSGEPTSAVKRGTPVR
jgi:hypothetical protein